VLKLFGKVPWSKFLSTSRTTTFCKILAEFVKNFLLKQVCPLFNFIQISQKLSFESMGPTAILENFPLLRYSEWYHLEVSTGRDYYGMLNVPMLFGEISPCNLCCCLDLLSMAQVWRCKIKNFALLF
jgi:hypothetical protein